MSDQYLVLMSDEIPLSRNFSRNLGISDKDSDEIINSTDFPDDGSRLMKVVLQNAANSQYCNCNETLKL